MLSIYTAPQGAVLHRAVPSNNSRGHPSSTGLFLVGLFGQAATVTEHATDGFGSARDGRWQGSARRVPARRRRHGCNPDTGRPPPVRAERATVASIPGGTGSPGTKQAAIAEAVERTGGSRLSGGYSPVRKLTATDRIDAFDCGQTALNQFLQRHALIKQEANSAQTYVCCQGDAVVGFYSLAVGSADPKDVPSRVVKGLARHPVPGTRDDPGPALGGQGASAQGPAGRCSRMPCRATRKPPTSPASAACWFTPRTTPRVSGKDRKSNRLFWVCRCFATQASLLSC